MNDTGIFEAYEIFYIESLLTFTKRIIGDYERLDHIITNQKVFQQNPFELIDLAESIINLSASISRYLKPTKKDSIHKTRGEKLSEYLKVASDNILLSRTVRNFIEHFDENLDLFLQTAVAGNIYPQRIIYNSSELDDTIFVFKCYVIKEFKYRTLDREIEIIPIVKEVYRIHNLLLHFKDNGGRLFKDKASKE
jgi:hypothetical protein